METNLGAAILSTGLYTGATVVTAGILKSPIGATGAAIFGISGLITGHIVKRLTDKVFDEGKGEDLLVATIVGIALQAFAAWKVVEAYGYTTTMTFTNALVLSTATTGAFLISILAMTVFSGLGVAAVLSRPRLFS